MNARVFDLKGFDEQGLDKNYNMRPIENGTGELEALNRIIGRSMNAADLVRRLRAEETYALSADERLHKLARYLEKLVKE